MSGYQLVAGADDFFGPEILDPGTAVLVRHDSSLTTTAMNDFPTSPEMSPSTVQSSPESDNLLPLRPLVIIPQGGVANSNPATLSTNSAKIGSSMAQTSWLDTVMSPAIDVIQADDTEISEAAGWLMDIRNDGTARPTKRQEIDNDVESDGTTQSAKRPRLPVPVSHGTRVAGKGRLASSSVPKHRVALVKAKRTGTRTPLPSCRALIELIPETVERTTHAHLEDSKFSQSFVAGRGWTSINDGPQTLLRPEDDLAIEINTIIQAPHTAASSTNRTHSNASSPPAINSTSPRSKQPGRSVKRASPRKRPAAKGKTQPASTSRRGAPPRNSSNTVSTTAGPSSDHVPIPPSHPPSDTSSDPTSPPASPRRPKWSGKPFRELTLEALRAATDTGHALDLAGIVAFIEQYRLTTDMQLPALNQTIRAAIHRLCVHKKPMGLWEREAVGGEYTGRYVLVERGLNPDAEVPDSSDDEESDDGGDEGGEKKGRADAKGKGRRRGKKDNTADKDNDNDEANTTASTS